jgi:hypothetical protein
MSCDTCKHGGACYNGKANCEAHGCPFEKQAIADKYEKIMRTADLARGNRATRRRLDGKSKRK